MDDFILQYYNFENTMFMNGNRMGLPSSLSETWCFVKNPQNGVAIKPFRKAHMNHAATQTQELLVLSPYLCSTTSATLTIEDGRVTPTSIMREFRRQS
jgi:hypothetical protein